jgi:hypothetical protein
MGCDIHGAIEKRVGDRWVMVDRLSKHEGAVRCYRRFAALAGVRGDGPIPNGLPDDISDSGALHFEELGVDAHSCGHAPLPEVARVFLSADDEHTDTHPDNFARLYPVSHYFGVDEEAYPGEYRLVFWFDN